MANQIRRGWSSTALRALVIRAARQQLAAQQRQQGYPRGKISHGEVLTAAVLNSSGIAYRWQAQVGPYRVDFLVGRVVLEIDGSQHHQLTQRRRDQQRDADLESHGYRVVRVAGSDLRDDPARMILTALDL